jgi:hypothetical protein
MTMRQEAFSEIALIYQAPCALRGREAAKRELPGSTKDNRKRQDVEDTGRRHRSSDVHTLL